MQKREEVQSPRGEKIDDDQSHAQDKGQGEQIDTELADLSQLLETEFLDSLINDILNDDNLLILIDKL